MSAKYYNSMGQDRALGNTAALDAKKLANLFYPTWWKYSGCQFSRESDKPLYVVHCANQQERELAMSLKPDCVRARYVLEPTVI
jgi:hypothetical protein